MATDLLRRLAAPISSWDTLAEIARDSKVIIDDLPHAEAVNLCQRFQGRKTQWTAAANTIEARIRGSSSIPKASWDELESWDEYLPPLTPDNDLPDPGDYSSSDDDDEVTCRCFMRRSLDCRFGRILSSS